MLKHKDTIINVGLTFAMMGALVVFGGNSTENNDAYRGLEGSVMTGGGTMGGGIIAVGGGASGMAKKTAEPAKKGACKEGSPCVPLLAPLGSLDRIPVQGGTGASGAVQTFINYFNNAWGLLRVISVGFCVLWILIGSFFILISGSDGGKRSTGKGIITWAIIGLIIVEFAGFFLRTLNDIFFV